MANDAVSPLSLRAIIGSLHAEFATSRQQDAGAVTAVAGAVTAVAGGFVLFVLLTCCGCHLRCLLG